MTINLLFFIVWRLSREVIMPLDIEKYRRIAKEFSLSEQEQDELIQVLWTTLESLVDQSLGRHPIQQCLKLPVDSHLQDPLESLKSKAEHPKKHSQHSKYQTLKY